MTQTGNHNKSDSVPWREAYREDITQKQLSELIGIPQRHISMMETASGPSARKWEGFEHRV